MNFSKDSIRNRLEDIEYGDTRAVNRLSHSLRTAVVFTAVLAVITSAALVLGAFVGIVSNSPDIKDISFSPTGFASKTYDTEGNLVATLVQAGSNREEAAYEDIPENLVNAFVAIEDQRFWSHNGIDLRSITRAVRGVFTGNLSAGGGSTITQQLIKNNVFGGGKETGFALYERKFQEWYIALALENQPDKDKTEIKKKIITDYLNTINLGSNTLGVKVAAKKYFGKSVSDLDLAECTVIASITKNPSRLNPLTHPDKNQERRLQVLENMVEQGYISEREKKAASSEEVYERIRKVNEAEKSDPGRFVYSFFTDELISQCLKAFREELGLTEKEAKTLLYSGGLTIHTTQDPAIQKIVDEEVNDPENYDTAKYSIKWSLTVTKADGSTASYSERDIERYIKEQDPGFDGLFGSRESAEEKVEEFRSTVVGKDDGVVSEVLDLTLEPQVSFVLLDQDTGEVRAISGGRGEKEYSLTMNRATNIYRQPGSTFKVIAAFAPAIEENGATLGTVYYDSRYSVGEKEYRNWWSGGEYFGWANIREGIEFSMNIVAVRCLIETVTPKAGAEFAEKLGISTLKSEDLNGGLALGGLTKGVTNLELTNAFAAIASGGMHSEYKLFTKIYDHSGRLLIDTGSSEPVRVMKESTAYLLTDAMHMSLVPHSKWAYGYSVSNTSSRSNPENMIAAGKSGTTTSNKDVWFVGFTPYYTAGIWAGCDENQPLYDRETGEYNGGTSFHKDIWRKIMERVHEGYDDPGTFEIPYNIVKTAICRKSGLLATDNCALDVRDGESSVYYEYFDSQNVPTGYCSVHNRDGTVNISAADLERGWTDDTRANAAIWARIEAESIAAAEAESIAMQEAESAAVSEGPGSETLIGNYGPGIQPPSGHGPGGR